MVWLRSYGRDLRIEPPFRVDVADHFTSCREDKYYTHAEYVSLEEAIDAARAITEESIKQCCSVEKWEGMGESGLAYSADGPLVWDGHEYAAGARRLRVRRLPDGRIVWLKGGKEAMELRDGRFQSPGSPIDMIQYVQAQDLTDEERGWFVEAGVLPEYEVDHDFPAELYNLSCKPHLLRLRDVRIIWQRRNGDELELRAGKVGPLRREMSIHDSYNALTLSDMEMAPLIEAGILPAVDDSPGPKGWYKHEGPVVKRIPDGRVLWLKDDGSLAELRERKFGSVSRSVTVEDLQEAKPLSKEGMNHLISIGAFSKEEADK